jgi:hypothetical protein
MTLEEKIARKNTLFDRAEAVAERKIADLMVYRKLKETAAPKPAGFPVPPTAEQVEAEKAAKPPRYLFETVSDLRSMPKQKWFVDQWIPEFSTGIIYGKWGAGKSFVGFDIILHNVYGMADWHGFKLPGEPCFALVIAREGHTGFVRRIDAFKKHHGIEDDTDRIVFMRCPVNFGDPAQFAELKAAVEASGRQFKMVMVDTVGRALPGEDINDAKNITRFMENLQQLGEIAQGVAIGIHHENKSGAMTGSIYFENSADFVLNVEREGEGALRRGKITCDKQKDGEDKWHRLVAYKLIETEPNGEGSLVVESITDMAGIAEEAVKMSTRQQNVLDCLKEAIRGHGKAGKVTVEQWRDVAYKRGILDEDATKRSKQFGDTKDKLIEKGRIKIDNGTVRLVSSSVVGTLTSAPTLPSSGAPMPPETDQ